MNTPDWVKPGVLGAVAGALIVSIVGFSWGGWVTERRATLMAKDAARESAVAALVPICIEMSQSDPNRATQLATIRATAAYERQDAVMASGWATIPGTETPDRALAQACLLALKIDES